MKMKRLAFFAAVLVAVGGVAFFCSRTSPKPVDQRTKVVKDVSATIASVSVPAAAQVARPTTADEFFAALPTNQTASARGTKPFVLTSEQAFQKSLRLVAESMGVRTVGVLSRHALLVEASPAARARLASDGRFKMADEFLPMRKVARELAAEVASGAETVQVAFLTLAPEDRLVVQRRVTAKGGAILEGCINDGDSFRATVPAECVAELAACGDVRWMEKFERPHLMNDLAVNPAAMNVRAIWKSEDLPEGLSGEGQTVTTSDSGIDTGNLDTLHRDLRDRVVGIKVVAGCYDHDVRGHGTHTAGSIVGNGTESGGQIRGSAWGAHLYAWFCGGADGYVYTPSSYDELFRPDQANWPAYIHSASWGSDTKGQYNARCSAIDGWVWSHPEFLPVYSAGNEGRSGRCTIGSPGAAKNVLTVGATQNLREGSGLGWWNTGNPKITAEYSSRGPCADGRIKPDIATPGSAVLSTRSHGVNYSYGNYNDFYAYDFGTSMACPLMAGNVALVREWLMRRAEFSDEDGKRPTAALMKAIVTGGAKDAAKPNNEQGWGRADIKETLYPSGGRAVKLVDRIPFAEGETFEYIVETTNSAPLDVQLAWVDYPGTASDGAQQALINDLDLTVEALEGGEGEVLLGNGGQAPDRLNNIESVRVASAAPDKYLITVTCAHIDHDYSEGGAAALYIRGAFDPDHKPTDLDRVRIRRTGETYATLDKALAEIQADDTVEVLSPVRLRKAVEIPVNCTIVATNVDASASTVTFLSDASLTVPDGVRVLFTNVVFAAEQAGTAVIHVASNGVAAVAGRAEVGEIQPEDEKGVEMAAPVENFVYVRCPVAQDIGQVFGFVTCDRDAAADCAAKFLNAYEAEYGGEVTDDGKLRWVRVPVDPAIAAAYHTDDGGESRVYYLHLHKVFGEKSSGDVVVIRNCTLEAPAEVSGAMRLVCTNESGAATITFATDTNATFYVASSASFSVSNLVLTGAAGEGAFVMNGGDLTLESGTVIEDCVNEVYVEGGYWSGAGAVTVLGGTLTMKSGATIRNCVTTYGCGGGVYVEALNDDALFEMTGGTIEDCQSAGYGGGAYIDMYAGMTLSGDATLVGSSSGAASCPSDNLYLATPDVLELTDELNGLVYLRCGADECTGGDAFALIAESCSLQAASNSAAYFRSDDDPATWHGAVGEDGETLVWSNEEVPIPQPPLENPVAWVIYAQDDGTSVTNEFASLDEALQSIQGDATVVVNAVGFPDDPAYGYEFPEEEIAQITNSVPYLTRNVTIRNNVVITTEENDDGFINTICRKGYVFVTVAEGGSLTLTNICFEGMYPEFEVVTEGVPAPLLHCMGWQVGGDDAMIRVLAGGELVMAEGSGIYNVVGSAKRDSCAVSVENGRFTMKDDAEIAFCENTWKDDQNLQKSPAGGVIVSGPDAVFSLQGGSVFYCTARTGGGALVENSAQMEISGDPFIIVNYLTDWETSADLSVSREATEGQTGELSLVGEFTGWIGILEPRLYDTSTEAVSVDTNVFGRVAEGLDLPALRPSAAYFFRDAAFDVTGLIVTNDTEALLVWSSAVDEDGVYRDKDGNEYKVVEDPPPPPTPTEIDPPTAVTGLIYNGNEQTGVVEADGYTVTDNVAVNAGDYTATVTLKDGYVWTGGSTDPLQIGWTIAKAMYDMSGVTFDDMSVEADGSPKSILVQGQLPAGVTVDYEGNGQTEPGSYAITAKFTGDTVNYEPIDDMTATLTITPKQDPDPDPPQWDVITNHPTPIAFQSIDRVSDTEWKLVVTNRVEYCNYRLIWTTDLTKGFTSTGAWEHAVGPAAAPTWTTNVLTTGGAWFWRAEGADGTNMVPHKAEGK